MATTVSIQSRDFLALQKAMRKANKDFYNQFRKELRRTLAYARDDIREDWEPVEDALFSRWKNPPSQPIKGGARNIESRVGPRSASVRATKSSNMRLLNQGKVRHPGYQAAASPTASGKGGGWPWFTTDAPSGVERWWDKSIEKVVPFVVQQGQLTLEHYAQKIANDINNG